MSKIDLRLGDCLEVMKTIEDNSIDAIITDPPYGTTACNWDSVIDFDLMWEQLNRIIKPNGAIVLHSSQPFTSALIMSNAKKYRHQWVWNKNNSAGFATAKIRPFAICEDIIVFGLNKVNYYPQMTTGKMRKKGGYSSSDNYGLKPTVSYNDQYYPKNLINISNASQKGKKHPTQKPIELMEYLIKTYTNERETVLDFTMGSGSTGVAAKNLNRSFIGIEQDDKYFKIAEERIKNKQL
jgi:site-specific DNA-methyltransferase (adenine-specific)